MNDQHETKEPEQRQLEQPEPPPEEPEVHVWPCDACHKPSRDLVELVSPDGGESQLVCPKCYQRRAQGRR
jgi:hypothetical protein